MYPEQIPKASRLYLTFAWYGQLRTLRGIALFEYLLQVPANRIGYTALSLGQLKILQEAITLMVFVPFAIIYMKQQPRLDFLWAGLCIIAAVYFVFRSHGAPA